MKTKKIIAVLLVGVMLLAFAGCKKDTSPTEPGTIYAGLNEIHEDAGLKDYYLKNPDNFMRAAQNEIGITEAQAQSFLSDSDNWQFYALNITINNNTDKNYTFISYKAGETPDGIWVSNCPVNGEFSVPAELKGVLYPASVLVDTSKVSLSDLYAAVAGLELNVLYYETPEDDETEVPESDYKELKVKINIVAPEDDAAPEEQISAKRTTIESNSAFLEPFRANDIAFSNQAKLFGMDSETAAKAISANGGWVCYKLNIEIVNKTDDDLTVNKIVVENNGKNGVWVCSVSEYGEYGMPANDKQSLPVTVLVDPTALGSKTAQDAIAEMNLKLEYVAGETVDEMGNEIVLPTKVIDVK